MLKNIIKWFDKRRKKPTLNDLLIRKELSDINVKSRFANSLLVAFLTSVFFSLVVIVLKGFGVMEISDNVVFCLLIYTIAQIPPMMITIIKLIFSK